MAALISTFAVFGSASLGHEGQRTTLMTVRPKTYRGCELLAPLWCEFFVLRELFPFPDFSFRETRIPNGIVPEVIRVPRFAAS